MLQAGAGMKRRAVLGVVLVTLTGGMGGYLLGANMQMHNVAPTPPVHVLPVHVSIEFDDVGGVTTVELTDADGNPVEVGSIAESYSDGNADAETD